MGAGACVFPGRRSALVGKGHGGVHRADVIAPLAPCRIGITPGTIAAVATDAMVPGCVGMRGAPFAGGLSITATEEWNR